MNGIIVHGTEIHYGNIAEFLFSRELVTRRCQQ